MCHPCTIIWEADVPPAVGCIAATPSLASLDQGLLGHLIWDEVCVCLGLSEFSFSYRNIVGTGGFYGRAIMWPRDVVLLLCPLVTPTPTLLQLGLLLPLSTRHSLTHSTPPGLAVLHSHQALEASTHYFGLVCFFPSPPPFTYPFHTTRSGSASLTSST